MNTWDIGELYEMYIGEKYEIDGFQVDYIGRLFGMNDHAIDLIASDFDRIFIIQCKFRSTGKSAPTEIMPAFLEKVNWFRNEFYDGRQVIGTIVTNTSFYPDGKAFAKEHGILLQTVPMRSTYTTDRVLPLPNMSFEEYILERIIRPCDKAPIQAGNVPTTLYTIKNELTLLQTNCKTKADSIERKLSEVDERLKLHDEELKKLVSSKKDVHIAKSNNPPLLTIAIVIVFGIFFLILCKPIADIICELLSK